jgi:hypothetical protein
MQMAGEDQIHPTFGKTSDGHRGASDDASVAWRSEDIKGVVGYDYPR